MKKSILVKAALVLLTLTASTFAHAQGVAAQEFDHEEGRIEAAAFNQVVDMKTELDSIVKKIDDLQNEVGFSTDDSQGVIKALGEKLTLTDELRSEYLEITKEMQTQSGDSLFQSFSDADKILKQARKNLIEAKKLATLAK